MSIDTMVDYAPKVEDKKPSYGIVKKTVYGVAVAGLLALGATGCTRTEAMVIGGLAGAAIGGPIGYQSGEALAGAAIGLGSGTLVGAIATEE